MGYNLAIRVQCCGRVSLVKRKVFYDQLATFRTIVDVVDAKIWIVRSLADPHC